MNGKFSKFPARGFASIVNLQAEIAHSDDVAYTETDAHYVFATGIIMSGLWGDNGEDGSMFPLKTWGART